jgi:Mg2+/Co2+ transporter CorB
MTEENRMITKLIKLEDGTLVEVEVLADQPKQIAAVAADKVAKQFDSIKPILIRVCKPISDSLE